MAKPESTSIYQSFALAQSEFNTIAKQGTARIGKGGSRAYKYATLDDILDHVRPILNKHGLCLMQMVNDEGLNTVIFNEKGESIESGYSSYQIQQVGGSVHQAEGIAITYKKRYQLSALLGISCEEDTDGDAGGKVIQKPQKLVANKELIDRAKTAIANGKTTIDEVKSKLTLTTEQVAELTLSAIDNNTTTQTEKP